MSETSNKGVDLIIDFVGADFFSKNLECAKLDSVIVFLSKSIYFPKNDNLNYF